MFNLKEAKIALSQCHLNEDSIVYQTLREVQNPEYFLLRAEEAVKAAKCGIDPQTNLKLAIQLLNIKRVLDAQVVENSLKNLNETLSPGDQ